MEEVRRWGTKHRLQGMMAKIVFSRFKRQRQGTLLEVVSLAPILGNLSPILCLLWLGAFTVHTMLPPRSPVAAL